MHRTPARPPASSTRSPRGRRSGACSRCSGSFSTRGVQEGRRRRGWTRSRRSCRSPVVADRNVLVLVVSSTVRFALCGFYMVLLWAHGDGVGCSALSTHALSFRESEDYVIRAWRGQQWASGAVCCRSRFSGCSTFAPRLSVMQTFVEDGQPRRTRTVCAYSYEDMHMYHQYYTYVRRGRPGVLVSPFRAQPVISASSPPPVRGFFRA